MKLVVEYDTLACNYYMSEYILFSAQLKYKWSTNKKNHNNYRVIIIINQAYFSMASHLIIVLQYKLEIILFSSNRWLLTEWKYICSIRKSSWLEHKFGEKQLFYDVSSRILRKYPLHISSVLHSGICSMFKSLTTLN